MVNQEQQSAKMIFVELHMNNGSIFSFGLKKENVEDFLTNLRGGKNKLEFDMPWDYEDGTQEKISVTIEIRNVCFQICTIPVLYSQYEKKAKERVMRGHLYVVNCSKFDTSLFRFS